MGMKPMSQSQRKPPGMFRQWPFSHRLLFSAHSSLSAVAITNTHRLYVQRRLSHQKCSLGCSEMDCFVCDLSSRIHLQRILPCMYSDMSPWYYGTQHCCCTCVSHLNTHQGLKTNIYSIVTMKINRYIKCMSSITSLLVD